MKVKNAPEVFDYEDKGVIEKRLLERSGLDSELSEADPAKAIVSAIAMELCDFKSYANNIALTQFRKWHEERAPKRFGYGEDYESRIKNDFKNKYPVDGSNKKEVIVDAKVVRAIDIVSEDEQEESYGKLIIYVRSAYPTGECSFAIIQEMQDFINKDDNKIKTDTIIVRSIKPVPFDLNATLDLYPTSPPSDVEKIAHAFLNEIESIRNIGAPIEISWLYSILHGHKLKITGVKSVDLSKTKIPKIGPGECFYLSECSIKPGSYRFD
ncbi:MAG: hypothetical protein AB8G05_01410 [Oligoflexales bacterium]